MATKDDTRLLTGGTVVPFSFMQIYNFQYKISA
jgi:hypothetical protein